MPQIGTIDVRVIEEAQSRMLSFKKNELDLVEIDGRSGGADPRW